MTNKLPVWLRLKKENHFDKRGAINIYIQNGKEVSYSSAKNQSLPSADCWELRNVKIKHAVINRIVQRPENKNKK